MEPAKTYQYKKHVIGFFPELTSSNGKKGNYKVCHQCSSFDQTDAIYSTIDSAKQQVNKLVEWYKSAA